MSDPIISYVVTVYNKVPYLRELVSSILAQSIRPIEIVFADDGSHDGSVDLLRAIADDISADDVTVRLVLKDQNHGPSAAINFGIRAATGEWIHFVDADDVLAPEASAMLLDAARTYGSDLVYGGKINLEDAATGQDFSQAKRSWHGDALLALIKKRLVGMRFFCTRQLASIGADERVFIQDVSLPYRLAYHANSLTILDAPVVLIRATETSVSTNKLQEYSDYLGAAALFLDEFDVSSEVRARIVRRCLGRIRKSLPTVRLLHWELMTLAGVTSSKASRRILREFLELQDQASLRKGRAFAEIDEDLRVHRSFAGSRDSSVNLAT